MTWWAWTLLWVLLVLAGAGVLFLAGRRLLRQGLALARELGEAADLLSRAGAAAAALGERGEGVPSAPAAVASAPSAPAAAPSGGGRRSSTRRTPRGRRRPSGSQDVR